MDSVIRLGVRGLNHIVANESWATERLRKHAGAHVRMVGGPLTIQLAIDQMGLFHLAHGSAEPDVRLRLPSDFVARMLMDRDNMFSAVKLEGSVDLAESLAFVFRNLAWDVEADLAAMIGDIPAHRLVRMGRSIATALRRSVSNAADNLREYAVDESALLANEGDITGFAGAVSALRDDVARLEKRVARFGSP